LVCQQNGVVLPFFKPPTAAIELDIPEGSYSLKTDAVALRCSTQSNERLRASLRQNSGSCIATCTPLQAAEKALNYPVLLGCVRCDELLAQPIVATCRSKTPTLENQSVVDSDHRRLACGPQSAESFDTCSLKGTLGLFRTSAQENSHPMSSRSQQSITPTRCPQPSRPQHMWVRSVAQRRSLRLVRLTEALTRGRGVVGR